MNENQTIYEFNRNSEEVVRFSINEFHGKRYADIRIFYKSNGEGEPKWIPTKKGVTVSMELLDELKKGIDTVIAKVELGE